MGTKLTDVIGKNFALKTTTKRISGMPVEIKNYLDVETFKTIVQTVAQSCFENNGYHAENREVARRYCVIEYMTDIELEDIDVPELFKTTQGGIWYSQIEAEVIKLPIWAEVEVAIDNEIAYLIETRQTAFDKLCSDLSAIIEVDNTQNLADIKEVLDKFEKVDKKAFVDKVINSNIAKNKGGETNGKKSKRATNKVGGNSD
jgi:hypothetical protein